MRNSILPGHRQMMWQPPPNKIDNWFNWLVVVCLPTKKKEGRKLTTLIITQYETITQQNKKSFLCQLAELTQSSISLLPPSLTQVTTQTWLSLPSRHNRKHAPLLPPNGADTINWGDNGWWSFRSSCLPRKVSYDDHFLLSCNFTSP